MLTINGNYPENECRVASCVRPTGWPHVGVLKLKSLAAARRDLLDETESQMEIRENIERFEHPVRGADFLSIDWYDAAREAIDDIADRA